MKTVLLIVSMFLILYSSCTRTTVTDADGNIYPTVIIGHQTWTVENLRTTTLNDGTPSPHVPDSIAWHNLTSPGYCYYQNTDNADTIRRLGALYNWYCVDSKKLAPRGWHVPTNDDWDTLQNYLIGHGYNWDRKKNGNRIAKSLAAQSGWKPFGIEGFPGNNMKDNNRSGFSGVADGIDEIRKLIRFEVKNGADLIKLFATAGVLSEEESAGAPQYSQEEMNVVVQEAAMWGKKVAAHAHGAEGIKRAVKAGVASIEHGSLIDEEGIQLMKQKGTFLVADIYNDDYISTEFKRLGYPEKILEKERSIALAQRENFLKAAKAGVKMAYGTDAGVYPHGWNGKQFAHMVRWGLTPMQALQSATVNAAELLGWQDRVGSISVGAFADIIAVKSDPLKDITVLETVDFVMKGGAVVKNRISK